MKNNTMKNKTMEDKTMKNNTMEDKTMKNKTMKNKFMKALAFLITVCMFITFTQVSLTTAFALDGSGANGTAEPGRGVSPDSAVAYPVKLAQAGVFFDTLSEAVAAAKNYSYGTFTIEVTGDVTENGDVVIGAENVTIIGVGGNHTVSGVSLKVSGGGSLTVGDGAGANELTFSGSVNVTNGTVNVAEGAVIDAGGRSSQFALLLSGPTANGVITGGRIEGNTAVGLEKGARISEISGGEFHGRMDAIHLSDAGTVIGKISGGSFYQDDPTVTLHGSAVFVQNYAQIDEISGGYFDAARNCAVTLIRGGKVGEISDGEFVVHRFGTPGNDDRNAAIWVENGWSSEGFVGTGIGTISGGHIRGTDFGLLLIADYGYCYVDSITGGTFEAKIALQNDRGSTITAITGGTFSGAQGILNVSKIGTIGGQTEIHATSSYGIFNYMRAQIDEISGGTIVSEKDHGIANAGTIKLISGGTIVGGRSAIHCDGMNKGRLETITNGVFLGKTAAAIVLAYTLTLEPGLSEDVGFGRYMGNNGVIFNKETLVNYPDGYWMSEETKLVEGFGDLGFKYLTNGRGPVIFTVTFEANGGTFDDGETTAERAVTSPETTVGEENMPGDPAREGYTFSGWNTEPDGSGVEFTGSTDVDEDVTVYAQWVQDDDGGDGGDGDGGDTDGGDTDGGDTDGGDTDGGDTDGGDTDGGDTDGGDTDGGDTDGGDTDGGDTDGGDTDGGDTDGGDTDGGYTGGGYTGTTVEEAGEEESPISPFITEHIAYINGYPDGTVGPNRNITRAEVATIFFRLLTDDVREKIKSNENPFVDVSKGMWYNHAVSVMYLMGIVQGYPGETFRPNDPITRAELATIAARFAREMRMDPRNSLSFNDVAGHWAEDDVNHAAAVGWVNGYPDGSFAPNRSITRAEVMTLVNRMLEREPESADDLLKDEMIKWPDNSNDKAWYYHAIQEATNSHIPAHKDKTVPGLTFSYEYWVTMIPNFDWTKLEKA